MPNLTNRLRLKSPVPEDAFARQDFVDNYALLDQYPGAFICTSGTRPTGWGSVREGMTIVETDTRRVLYWNGSTWKSVHAYPTMYRAASNSNILLGGSGNPTSSPVPMMTIPLIRPCALYITTVVGIQKAASTPQQVTMNTLVNGGDANWGEATIAGFSEGGTGAANSHFQTFTMLGYIEAPRVSGPTITVPGNAAVSINLSVAGSGFSNQVTIVNVKTFVQLAEPDSAIA